jgi:hypothetical protein
MNKTHKIAINYAVDPFSVGDENPERVAEFFAAEWSREISEAYPTAEITVSVGPSTGEVYIGADAWEVELEVEKSITEPNRLWERYCARQNF